LISWPDRLGAPRGVAEIEVDRARIRADAGENRPFGAAEKGLACEHVEGHLGGVRARHSARRLIEALREVVAEAARVKRPGLQMPTHYDGGVWDAVRARRVEELCPVLALARNPVVTDEGTAYLTDSPAGKLIVVAPVASR